MSNPIGTYSFLPWLRQGIANKIGKTMSNQNRATVPISLKLKGDPVKGTTRLEREITQNIQLFGPGDFVGINSQAIVKVEPHHWITNFEPNYLPYIEFYDEDFPWRYTPTAPDTAKDRLSPWIMLVVLKGEEGENAEFEDGKTIKGKPLPYIKITVPDVKSVFPPADQLWAWAHVHVNQDLTLSQDDIVSKDKDIETILPKFQKMLTQDPDVAYSRILCPRRLDANTGYHAFLIPVFETGRLAGLGLKPNKKLPSATHSAWEHYDEKKELEPNHYPYYHRWYFRTGTVGDFEYLVRLLQPKPVDKRVGTRAMDVQNPGSNLPGINTEKVKGVLRLGGALKVPKSTPPDDNWAQPYPQEFQQKLAAFINLADDYAQKGALKANEESGLWEVVEPEDGEVSERDIDPDPLITPPLYGRWHSLTQRLLSDRQGNPVENRKNWVHKLNLDPRFRVAAGFGTRVIQDQQEEYMNQAWAQVGGIGGILEVNQRRRNVQLALTSTSWYAGHLTPLMATQPEKAFAFMAPVHSRLVCEGLTVSYRLKTSIVPKAAVSTTMRRLMRPRGRLMQALSFTDSVRPDNLLDRINSGEVSAAPPRETPAGVMTLEDFSRILAERIPQAPEVLSEENQIPERVDDLPESEHFDIFRPEDDLPILPPGGPDSPEAERFKIALRDMYSVFVASKEVSEEPAPSSLDLSALTECLFQGLNPDITIPRRIRQMEQLPARLEAENGEDFTEVMAYPEFDIPMYKPLTEISSELFLPNINLIEQNSITLLETNQPFIESYMVGLNHEMGRELLWREYPTDQRGSYFRQFWDVRSYYDPKAPDADKRREKLKDIPPLHLWSKTGKLGDHDHREKGEDEEELVLVIRGELLKKYPTAVIYAHRARWQMKDGKVDNTVARLPIKLEAAEQDNPPRNKVKTPLYSAKIEPDIYFFGFDLTPKEAKGGTGTNATKETDESGWFFVIKERPGEPRFGLDVGEAGALDIWNDLSWEHVLPGKSPGSFIQITENSPSFPLTNLPKEHKKRAQQDQDKEVKWNKDTNSADLAYILYQTPVLVAVHAAEMLQPF